VGQTIQNTLNSHVAAFKDSVRKTVQQYKKYEPQADYIARKQTTASTRLAGIDLNLSPNPATHHITLSVSGNLDENYTWSIVNSMGITKQTGKTCCYDFYQNSETIDISSLLSGVYTLKLTSGIISQSVHFIKQ
jgi:hypothetical protein